MLIKFKDMKNILLTLMICLSTLALWGQGGEKVASRSDIVDSLYSNINKTYYVDATNGNDSYSGLSPTSAWQTLSKVHASSFKPGDKILFKRNEIFRGALIPPSSGDSIEYIYFGAYGDGAAPLITANEHGSFNLTWEDRGSNIYAAKITLGTLSIRNVSENGVPLIAMKAAATSGNITDITASGQWVQNKSVDSVYVRTNNDANPQNLNIELGTLYAAFGSNETSDARDYIYVEDLSFQGGYYAVEIQGNHIVINNCIISNCYGDGIKVMGGHPSDADNPEGTYDFVYSDVLLTNNKIFYFGESGIDNTGAHDVTISYNDIFSGTANRGNLTDSCYNNGILFKNNTINAVVFGNEIHDMTVAFGAISIGGSSYGGVNDESVNSLTAYNLIYNISTITNISKTTPNYIIAFTAAKNAKFYNNTIANCTVTRCSNIRCLIMSDRSKSTEPTYYSDTVYIKNNIIYNNTVYENYLYSESAVGDVDSLICSNNIIEADYNFKYNGTAYTSIGDWQAIGMDVNTMTTDPNFYDDYTLISGSPAINTGINVFINIDKKGDPVFGLPDMGCYEYNTYKLTGIASDPIYMSEKDTIIFRTEFDVLDNGAVKLADSTGTDPGSYVTGSDFATYVADTISLWKTGEADTTGVVPDYIGQFYMNTADSTCYVSVGTTSGGWKKITTDWIWVLFYIGRIKRKNDE